MKESNSSEIVSDALVAIEHLCSLNLHVFDSETRGEIATQLNHCICSIIFSLHKSLDQESWDEYVGDATGTVKQQEEVIKKKKPHLN
mgnify:CR=1 FL=1|tara:strand:- start:335 stop:595 length:261 start_codon:yes stop_codon:yes gene_type:complete